MKVKIMNKVVSCNFVNLDEPLYDLSIIPHTCWPRIIYYMSGESSNSKSQQLIACTDLVSVFNICNEMNKLPLFYYFMKGLDHIKEDQTGIFWEICSRINQSAALSKLDKIRLIKCISNKVTVYSKEQRSMDAIKFRLLSLDIDEDFKSKLTLSQSDEIELFYFCSQY